MAERPWGAAAGLSPMVLLRPLPRLETPEEVGSYDTVTRRQERGGASTYRRPCGHHPAAALRHRRSPPKPRASPARTWSPEQPRMPHRPAAAFLRHPPPSSFRSFRRSGICSPYDPADPAEPSAHRAELRSDRAHRCYARYRHHPHHRADPPRSRERRGGGAADYPLPPPDFRTGRPGSSAVRGCRGSRIRGIRGVAMASTAPAQPSKPRGPSARLDLATLAGMALALVGILGGLILEKGSMQDVVQGTAAMIVLGGTFGAVLITNPLPVVLRACIALRGAFLERGNGMPEAIEELIQYATKARKNGIVSLESEAAAIADPFLRKALGLAVDGTDLQVLRQMMETDIALAEEAGEAEAKVWEAAGGYAPTIGIIGAVMGLIQVMKHVEDVKEVGHGIAVAFVATIYGVASANILFLPLANKLRARLRATSRLRDMTLEGVVGIVEGLNPTLIRLKLDSYNDAPKPAKSAKKAKGAKGAEQTANPGAAAKPAA